MHVVQDHYADPILDSMVSREIIIDNRGNSNEHEDYQVHLKIDTEYLFFAAQDGLRFADENLKIIDHWNESFPAKQWLEAPKIPASAMCALQMLNGNPSVSSASNGANTFLLFDDFEDGDGSWISPSTNPLTSAQAYQGSYSRSVLSPTTTYIQITLPDSFIIEANVKVTTTGDGVYPLGTRLDAANKMTLVWGYPAVNEVSFFSSPGWVVLTTYSTTPWYELRAVYDSLGHSSTPYQIYIDNVLKLDWTSSGGGNEKPNEIAMWNYASKQGYTDNVRVRNYASPEPTAEVGGLI